MTSSNNQAPQDKKEALLNAAEELFAEYGFEGSFIRMVTERYGVNSAMINYHFGSKKAFFVAIFEFRLEQINHEVRELGSFALNPYQSLKAYLNTFIRRIELNHGLHQLLRNPLATRQYPAAVTLVSKAGEQVFMLIRSIGQEGTKTGCFRRVEVEMFAMNVLFLLPYVLTCEMVTLTRPNCTPLSLPRRTALANWIITYLLVSISIIEPVSYEVSNG
ncbi:TetR/AcrR family transcriptional regulator [Pontibacter silvestris]|uniref:TetR/AcrR family transcriptional regulator n=1 Tax=Pontibacter silvestris TaxID=2305183 RepID=A0ABW4WYB0_9BACT|nr:TetR/AcrR family transcriptional regulator [Pontibacter silvestris]MCC9138467.1 TetR/AcrR family transcriptional regulator [Pontibacter silvestris]